MSKIKIDGWLGKAGRWNLTINHVNESSYGHDGDSVYEDSRAVVFHDGKHPCKKWPIGQPVSGYYVQTLLEDKGGLSEGGLNLDGGVPEWEASPDEMKKVFKLIDSAKK